MLVKKPLLDVIFASEKRKGVLLLLHDGAKEMEFLLSSLDTTRQALLPQVKVLEEHYLVSHEKDTYELTTIGKLISDEMSPLMDTLDTLNADIDYWGTHRLGFIPHHLLKRMNELGKCNVINPCISNMYEINKSFNEATLSSKSVFVVTTFMFPNFSMLASELISRNISMHAIISTGLLDKMKSVDRAYFTDLVKNKLFHFFVYSKKMDFISFAYNEHNIMLSPLTKNGGFDNKHILCQGPSALKWGKELFDYYWKDSVPITEI